MLTRELTFNSEVEVLLELPLLNAVLKELGIEVRLKGKTFFGQGLNLVGTSVGAIVSYLNPMSSREGQKKLNEEEVDFIQKVIKGEIRNALGLPSKNLFSDSEKKSIESSTGLSLTF